MITLLTDFGYAGYYVGSMKGVMLTINPQIQIMDISHAVSPQNIDQGAFILKQSYKYFPEGTIHVAVVDPGVGSSRTVIAVSTGDYIFLAPDNGILKYIYGDYSDYKVIAVSNSSYFLKNVSTTFHGRDIFAPVAAHLSLGVDINNFGDETTEYNRPEIREPVQNKNQIIGEVIYIDAFGNCITNIGKEFLRKEKKIQVRVKSMIYNDIKSHYSAVKKGETLVLTGSSGMMEISVNQGSAQERYGFRVGDEVVIKEVRVKNKGKK